MSADLVDDSARLTAALCRHFGPDPITAEQLGAALVCAPPPVELITALEDVLAHAAYPHAARRLV